MDLENKASEVESDHEKCLTCSEEETVSEDETPTTSDEDFIVSDSEMEEVGQEDAEEDQIEFLFETFVNLQEEQKILKKELQKQSRLLFANQQELKKIISEVLRSARLAGEVHSPDFEPSRLHSKSSSVFWGEAETQLLFCINYVSCQSMTPLSFFPGNRIQGCNHFPVCFIFAAPIIPAQAVIHIMLRSNSISFSTGLHIIFQDFSSCRIISQLFFQWIIWPSVIMPRESPSFFWFWKFSDCFVNVNFFSFLLGSLCSPSNRVSPRGIVKSIKHIAKNSTPGEALWPYRC